MEVTIDQLVFDEHGLIPAVVQDAGSGEVLTLAYMNETSLWKTIQTKETWFFSRKRKGLWHKGETSGSTQEVQKISYDCDADALLVHVQPNGPACHTGETSCFHNLLYQQQEVVPDVLSAITEKIKERRQQPVDGSYTTYLFCEGIDKVLKKVGEEASEVIIGAKNSRKQEVTWEISDLVYHTLVLMEMLDVSVNDIKQELAKRHVQKEGKDDE